MIRQRGFTLLELVVVMAIMVVIGVAASSTFGQAVDNRDRLAERAQALADLQRAFLFLQRDFEQVVARGARDDLGDPQPFLRGDSEEGVVELTRVGWINPLDSRQRSSLQRVRYRYEDGKLWRDYWEHPDRQSGSEPVAAVLLEDVLSFQVQFLHRAEAADGRDGDFNWQDSWPLADDSEREPAFQRAPLAVSIELESKRFGVMKRFFRIVANPHARET